MTVFHRGNSWGGLAAPGLEGALRLHQGWRRRPGTEPEAQQAQVEEGQWVMVTEEGPEEGESRRAAPRSQGGDGYACSQGKAIWPLVTEQLRRSGWCQMWCVSLAPTTFPQPPLRVSRCSSALLLYSWLHRDPLLLCCLPPSSGHGPFTHRHGLHLDSEPL